MIEFALAFNAVLSINRASQTGALIAGQAGNNPDSDCVILSPHRQGPGSARRPEQRGSDQDLPGQLDGSTILASSTYQRSGSMTCGSLHRALLTPPRRGYPASQRCNILAGCPTLSPPRSTVDKVGVQITYRYDGVTPLRVGPPIPRRQRHRIQLDVREAERVAHGAGAVIPASMRAARRRPWDADLRSGAGRVLHRHPDLHVAPDRNDGVRLRVQRQADAGQCDARRSPRRRIAGQRQLHGLLRRSCWCRQIDHCLIAVHSEVGRIRRIDLSNVSSIRIFKASSTGAQIGSYGQRLDIHAGRRT